MIVYLQFCDTNLRYTVLSSITMLLLEFKNEKVINQLFYRKKNKSLFQIQLFSDLHVTYISFFAISLQYMSWFCCPAFGMKSLIFISFASGVALTLCQSDPVLNDGRSKQGQSREAVLDGVRRRFLEKVVAQHEDDDGSSSD